MSALIAAATLPTMPATRSAVQPKAMHGPTLKVEDSTCSAEEASPSDSAVGKKKKQQQTKGSYKGQVSRIGAEPKISIEGMGEFRFAYRNVKRQLNEGKPIVNLGDHVFCRLTLTEPPKAVCVRLLKEATVSVPTTPVSDATPSFPLPPVQAPAVQPSLSSLDSIGNTSPMSAPSRPPSALFTHDPYSFSGVRYLSQPPTPSSSMSMSQECTSGSVTPQSEGLSANWCEEALSIKRCVSLPA